MLGGCASTPKTDPSEISWQDQHSLDFELLQQSVESAYYREQELVERLHKAEQESIQLRQQLADLLSGIKTVDARLDSLHSQSPPPDSVRKTGVLPLYQQALGLFKKKSYKQALVLFDEVLITQPRSSWADNAQYWKGECYYALSKFRLALTEFTQISTYSKTEKADDAQLKIGRCHLALGEREQAVAAFNKLLDEHPDSEYVPRARTELNYLGG